MKQCSAARERLVDRVGEFEVLAASKDVETALSTLVADDLKV